MRIHLDFEIKKKHIYIALIIILFAIISTVNIKGFKYDWKEYFSMSFYEILTLVVGSVVIYGLTKRDSKEAKLYEKIENKCEELKSYIENNLKNIPSMKREEKLLKIRYVNNKIDNIGIYVGNIDRLSDTYKKMKDTFEQLYTFISDNIDMDCAYFENDNRKIKLEQLINNLELKLEDIIIFTYK